MPWHSCLQTVAASGRGNAIHRADTQALRTAKPTAGPPDRLFPALASSWIRPDAPCWARSTRPPAPCRRP
eukprot:15480424-Alexandrium_andersonii.AAC.1